MTDDDINKRAWRGILIIFALVAILVFPVGSLPVGTVPLIHVLWNVAIGVFCAIIFLWPLLCLLGAKLGERYEQQSEPGGSPVPVDLPPPTVDCVERATKENQS